MTWQAGQNVAVRAREIPVPERLRPREIEHPAVYFTREVEEFAPRLRKWLDALESRELPPVVSATASGRGARHALVEFAQNLLRRYREGPDTALRLALFGPTGAGKSKIFCSLVGSSVSPSGFHRPYTRKSTYYVHRDRLWVAASLPVDTVEHDDDAWRDVILIDTPDFDSVETANRTEAERIYLEADAFLFVTDVQKYADASTWEYLERIFGEEKPCRVLLNKLRGDGPRDDFLRRLEERWGERGRQSFGPVFGEYPIDDETLLPEGETALEELRQIITDLSRTEEKARGVVRDAFRSEVDRFVSQASELHLTASTALTGSEALRDSIRERYRAAGDKLRDVVTTQVGEGTRSEVYSRVLEKLERIDLLRYPRKLIAMPWEGLRTLWRKTRGTDTPETPPPETTVASMDSFQILEGKLITLAEETRAEIEATAGFEKLLDRDTFLELSMGHAEIQERYARVVDEFREWVSEEARKTADEIAGESKVKFILSQVIFNSILIGIQIKTAGVFTLAELAADGVLSPLAAKAVGMAVSSETVRAFELKAHEEHHRRVLGILDASRDRFLAFVDRGTEGLGDLVQWLGQAREYSTRIDDLSMSFAKRRYRLPTEPDGHAETVVEKELAEGES